MLKMMMTTIPAAATMLLLGTALVVLSAMPIVRRVRARA